MKYFFCLTACILAFPVSLTAQFFKRPIYFHLKSIKTDTSKKEVQIYYTIRNTDLRDSLSVSIKRANGQEIPLKEAYGAIGKNLMDGRGKIIYWNPIKEHQKFNENVDFIFNIKTIKAPGINFTRRQRFNAIRWGISGCTAALSLYEGLTIDQLVKAYNQDYPPTNLVEKEVADSEMRNLQARQQRFLYFEAASAAVLLTNVIISIIDCKHKLKPSIVQFTSTKTTFGLAYNF